MSRMAVEMLTDIEKDTIDWDPNLTRTEGVTYCWILTERLPPAGNGTMRQEW